MLITRFTLRALAPLLAATSCQMASAFTPPPIDTTIAASTSRVAITQVINSWAMRSDQGNSVAAASFFSPASQLSLYFNDTSGGQPKLTPTGYSASNFPTGGTAGAGCKVQGPGSIANFFAGSAGTYGPSVTTRWPSPDYRTNLLNSLIDFQDTQNATVRSYVVKFAGTPSKPLIYYAQLLTQVQFSQTAGWQITNMQFVFDTAQPNFPCKN